MSSSVIRIVYVQKKGRVNNWGYARRTLFKSVKGNVKGEEGFVNLSYL